MKTIRVVLIDDNACFRAAAAMFISSLRGIDIVGQSRVATDALADIDTLQPNLVLIDVTMPAMNGFEAIRLLKNRTRPPKVVMLSLHSTDAYRRRAMAKGADGFIAKDELVAELPRVLETLFPSRGQ